jgi:hypothetical protein
VEASGVFTESHDQHQMVRKARGAGGKGFWLGFLIMVNHPD